MKKLKSFSKWVKTADFIEISLTRLNEVMREKKWNV
jgi:hypothetical protein